MKKIFSYDIISIVLWFVIYVILDYFTEASFPFTAVVTTIVFFIFFSTAQEAINSIYILIPIFSLAILATVIIPIINGEWALTLSFVFYFVLVYSHSKLKLYLIKKKGDSI